jgi:adenylate kinase family enzyme
MSTAWIGVAASVKKPAAMEATRRIMIMGNGGCGKTWLARQLGARTGLPVVHLDDVHWEPGHRGIARDRALRDADVERLASGDGWIMEGIYGQIVALVAERLTDLVWLDLPEAECIANIRARGRQGEESEESFDGLIDWVAKYRIRTANWNSFEAHLRLYQAFPPREAAPLQTRGCHRLRGGLRYRMLSLRGEPIRAPSRPVLCSPCRRMAQKKNKIGFPCYFSTFMPLAKREQKRYELYPGDGTSGLH